VLNCCGYGKNSKTFLLTLDALPYFVIIRVITWPKTHVNIKGLSFIDIRRHFLRDNVKKGLISTTFCATDKQIVDIFTKVLRIE